MKKAGPQAGFDTRGRGVAQNEWRRPNSMPVYFLPPGRAGVVLPTAKVCAPLLLICA